MIRFQERGQRLAFWGSSGDREKCRIQGDIWEVELTKLEEVMWGLGEETVQEALTRRHHFCKVHGG